VRRIDYKPDHLRELMAGKLNAGAPEHIGYMADYAEELQKEGWSYTLVNNGHLICCAGLVDMWPGVGEGWFIASEKIHKDARPFIRFARQIQNEVIEQNDLWRVQACVRVGWDAAKRFANFLGYKDEGIMQQYGPNRDDYYRVAWLKDGMVCSTSSISTSCGRSSRSGRDSERSRIDIGGEITSGG